MEETKLTDEEIVKELINESNRGEWSNINFIDCVEVKVLKNAIDLIRRLQKENEELRSPKFASWKLKFFNLKEKFDKELAEHKKFTQKSESEIKRLTRELDDTISMNEVYVKAATENAKQQEEIKRLMSEIDQRREMMHCMDCNYATQLKKIDELQKQAAAWEESWKVANEKNTKIRVKLKKENAELQKQVDELKERVTLYETNATNMEFVKHYTKQAVKDMVKEIYSEIGDSDTLVVETQGYGEIEVVPIERLKEVLNKREVELQ